MSPPNRKYQSPVKREVANKFVKVLETIGNYEFNAEDISSQEDMIQKLNYVESNIKKLKGNIREYNYSPVKT